jgi:hypothetical protein
MLIEPMSVGDVEAIAALHRRSIDWSMTSQLGHDHVRTLYATLLAQPHFFGFVCYDSGRLVGFSTATFDYPATRATLAKLYGRHLPRILLMALAKPKYLVNLIESRFLLPRLYAQIDTRAEWLSLVSNPSESRLAPAATVALIRRVMATFRQAGVKSVVGQSYARNRRGLREFYARFGGTVVRKLWINDFYVFRT